MSHETIFVSKNGSPSRHQYLGKAGSQAYLKAVEALARRGRIEALERWMRTLSMGLEDLVEKVLHHQIINFTKFLDNLTRNHEKIKVIRISVRVWGKFHLQS